MITLTFTMLLIAVISTLSLRKTCKEKGKEFDPFAGSFIQWMGFYLGWLFFTVIIISYLIYLEVKYLP